MLLKTIGNALGKGDLGTAMRLAGHLFEIGGETVAHEDRKVHVLLRAMEGANPGTKLEFTAMLLERFGSDLGREARDRLAGRLDRI